MELEIDGWCEKMFIGLSMVELLLEMESEV